MHDIFDELVKSTWLYEKIFWKLLSDLVYDQELEKRKNILTNVYWFRNIDNIFKKEIERDEFENLSKIIFKYQEKTYIPPEQDKWIFNFNK
jgi:hypothetical protein